MAVVVVVGAKNAKQLDEERFVKILRQMASLPHNRQCFDCGQRGPTYINATIGSFVCMTCSGILRGLNPPHRVKSISVASFTAEEIDFIRSRGNDFCRKVWQNSQPLSQINNAKDEHRIRDSMSEKYEKKRWYVPPQESMYEEARKQNATSDTKETTNRSLSSMIGNGHSILSGHDGQQFHSASIQRPSGMIGAHLASGARLTHSLASPVSPTPRSPTDQVQAKKPTSVDLLADFGGDPFETNSPSQHSASFPAFSAFNSNPQTPSTSLQNAFSSANHHQAVETSVQNAPATAADRYLALAELDGVFSSAATATKVNWDASPMATTSHPRAGASWAGTPSVGLPQYSPFGASSSGGVTGSNPFGMSSGVQSPVYNPFVGNLMMTPGYCPVVSPTYGQFSAQPGMAYGQFCAMPVTTGVMYGFPNGMGNGFSGKTPTDGLLPSGVGWGQPSAGGNPFTNTSTNNTLNPFM